MDYVVNALVFCSITNHPLDLNRLTTIKNDFDLPCTLDLLLKVPCTFTLKYLHLLTPVVSYETRTAGLRKGGVLDLSQSSWFGSCVEEETIIITLFQIRPKLTLVRSLRV